MKFGLLFSGQGAQRAGMGIDFLADPLFKETVEIASEASGQDIVADFKSEHDELKKTVHVQPALVAFEAGIYRMLQRDLPDFNAAGMVGLSLGEYGAMIASKAISLKEGISLVSDRAKYMQEDADQVSSSMAALIKPDVDKVNAILTALQNTDQQVYFSNFNSPNQIVIGGEESAVKKAVREINDQEAAKRAVELKVNGAFHTPLFNEASKKMHQRLANVSFAQVEIPVISNTTVKPFTDDWAEIMERQLAVPTHFGSCVQYLIDQVGIDATLEIGLGKTLSSFARQVDRKLEHYHIGNLTDYQKFIEEEHGIKK